MQYLASLKLCTKCDTYRPIDQFHKNKVSKDGRHNYCKACRIAYQKEWHKNNPTYHTDYINSNHGQSTNLFRKYGITKDQYNSMLAEQNGNCKICKTHYTKFKRDLHVDHCHQTGKVRGLLCVCCNTGLGKFKDSIELLQQAITYIQS